MANWTRATLLGRLADEMSKDQDYDADDLIDRPAEVLGEVMAFEVIEQLKAGVVKEAMGKR